MYIYNCIYIFLPIHTMFMSMFFHVFTLELVKSEKGQVGCGNGNVFFCPVYGNFSRGKMSESGDFTIKCIHMIHMYSNVGVTFFRTNPLKMNRK